MDESLNRKIVPPDDLEVFDRRKPPPTEDPWVTRTKSGYFVFNRASYAALGEPAALQYVYSPSTQILGFRAADPEATNAYPVYNQGHSKNYQSAAQALHSFYGLSIDQTLRYKAELIEDTLYIDLKDEEALPVGRKARSEG
jgi:hypothetical protein